MRSGQSRSVVWTGLLPALLLTAALLPSGALFAGEPQELPNGMFVGISNKNDVSPALRDIPEPPVMLQRMKVKHEKVFSVWDDMAEYDPVVQDFLFPEAMPAPVLNFDGIPFPGVACNCAPPDTNGEVGATQYVQSVNIGLQVFNKTTGASVLGPVDTAPFFGFRLRFVGTGTPASSWLTW